MQQANNQKFIDYEWLELLNNGLLKQMKVPELDKWHKELPETKKIWNVTSDSAATRPIKRTLKE